MIPVNLKIGKNLTQRTKTRQLLLAKEIAIELNLTADTLLHSSKINSHELVSNLVPSIAITRYICICMPNAVNFSHFIKFTQNANAQSTQSTQ